MNSKFTYVLLVIICSLCLISCRILPRGYDPGIKGKYTLQFSTNGDCSMFLNGKEVSGTDLTTAFPKYNDSENALRQSQNRSSKIEKGDVRCFEPYGERTGIHRELYEIGFDPSLISDASAIYNDHDYELWPGYSERATVRYSLRNERVAGIDVPEGVCINISARSFVFELSIRNVSGDDVYTVEGEANYFCGGLL